MNARVHGFLDAGGLESIGFRSLGRDVRIDESAIFYGADRITVGSHVRIDAYAVISAGEGGIEIGDHVHIATFVAISGAATIVLRDFSGLSGRVSIYSSNDDYHGEGLTGPTVPMKFRKVKTAPVTIGRHVVVGANSVILPGVTIGDGSAVGALSLVKHDIPAFAVAAGIPVRVFRERSRVMFNHERELLAIESAGRT
jgi:galactoside O-acetyltransferase